MTNYSITQKSRGGNIRARQIRYTIGDCYRRISEGNGTPNDVKTALADAKRTFKKMAAELATLDINASTVTADELQQHMADIEDLAYGNHPISPERTAARKRYMQIERLAGVIWFREFIAKHK